MFTRSQAKQARSENKVIYYAFISNEKACKKKNQSKKIEEKTIKIWFDDILSKYFQDIEENKKQKQNNLFKSLKHYDINNMRLWTELLFHIRTYSEITEKTNSCQFISTIIQKMATIINNRYWFLIDCSPRNQDESKAYQCLLDEIKLTVDFLNKFTISDREVYKIITIRKLTQEMSNMVV